MPVVFSNQWRSASVVAGVMRSTMELGKAPLVSSQLANAGERSAATPRVAMRDTVPLPGRLSQLNTVNGG